MPYKDPIKQRAYDAAYYAANREKKRARSAAYRAAHRKEITAYRAAHKEEKHARDAAYRVAHREEARAYWATYGVAHREEKSAYNAAYSAANHEELRAYHASWYQKHRSEIALEQAAYYQANREKKRVRCAARRALKIGVTIGNHAEIAHIYDRAHNAPKIRCYLCGKIIPPGKRHVDHITPLSKGGQHRAANLAIACASCNCSKGSKRPNEIGLLL